MEGGRGLGIDAAKATPMLHLLKRTRVAVSLTVVLLGLVACDAPKPVVLAVSCDAFSTRPHMEKTTDARVGDSFTVTLCSNRTTGFLWPEAAQISDTSVVQQLGHTFTAPQAASGGTAPPVGAAGQETWTLKAQNKGRATITLGYSRPWEGGEKNVWALALTVVVD